MCTFIMHKYSPRASMHIIYLDSCNIKPTNVSFWNNINLQELKILSAYRLCSTDSLTWLHKVGIFSNAKLCLQRCLQFVCFCLCCRCAKFVLLHMGWAYVSWNSGNRQDLFLYLDMHCDIKPLSNGRDLCAKVIKK